MLRITWLNAGAEPVRGYLEPGFDFLNLEVWISDDAGPHWEEFLCQRGARWSDMARAGTTLQPDERRWAEEIVAYTFTPQSVHGGWALADPGRLAFPAPGSYLVRATAKHNYWTAAPVIYRRPIRTPRQLGGRGWYWLAQCSRDPIPLAPSSGT